MSDVFAASFLLGTNLILVKAYTTGALHERVVAVWSLCLCLVLTVAQLAKGNLTIACADGAVVALWLHWLWKHRPPRNRRPSRVAGIVKNLGHRLVVSTEGT